jgi:hypothetical protein
MQQLLYVVHKVLLEPESSHANAVLERFWSLFHNFDYFLKCGFLLLIKEIYGAFSLIDQQFVKALRLKGKQVTKQVLGPLNAMKGFLWEHFECAMRYLSLVVVRVSLASI